MRRAAIANVLGPTGQAAAADRRAAFDHATVPAAARALIDKLVINANQLTDADFAAATAAGLGEDHLFELIVCGSMGQATRQLDAALAVLALAEPS